MFRENRKYSRTVVLPLNNVSLGILDLLVRNKRLQGYRVLKYDNINLLSISLCYVDNKPRLNYCQFISTPGHRIYVSVNCLRRKILRAANNMFVVSTAYGLLSGSEAVVLNIGGELVCTIW